MDIETARWLIGLLVLAVVAPFVGRLNSRINAMDTKIDTTTNETRKQFYRELNGVNSELSAFKQDIQQTLGNHRQDYYDRLLTIHQSLAELSSATIGIKQRLDDIIDRQARYEDKLDRELDRKRGD